MQAIVDYPDKCILILMKFQIIRLSNSLVKILQKYMDCFPLKEFWKHAIIIRTHVDKSYKKFQREKKIEGSIVRFIRDNDFESFRNFIDRKQIALPDINVDCDKGHEPNERFESKEEKISLVFNAIQECKMMFKEIKTIDREEIDKSGQF